MKTCGSCSAAIELGKEEYCWYCDAYLCYTCWEEKGHCGHKEADAINRASNLTDREGRAKLARALWPDGEHLVPTEKKDDDN